MGAKNPVNSQTGKRRQPCCFLKRKSVWSGCFPRGFSRIREPDCIHTVLKPGPWLMLSMFLKCGSVVFHSYRMNKGMNEYGTEGLLLRTELISVNAYLCMLQKYENKIIQEILPFHSCLSRLPPCYNIDIKQQNIWAAPELESREKYWRGFL